MQVANVLRSCVIVTILALLPLSNALAENTQVEMIELQGRTADEMIPLLKPVVEPEGTITGTGFQLIVKATPAKMAELKRLLREIDHAPTRLVITVHTGDLRYGEQRSASAAVQASRGDVTIKAGDEKGTDEDSGGIYFGDSGGENRASARVRSTRSLGDSSDRQQVQTLEGQAAYIATGTDYPYPSHLEVYRGGGTRRYGGGISTGVEYKHTETGFYALARLRGDQVFVDISPRKEGLSRKGHGAIDTQRISTTVSGRVGEWIRLGGVGSGGYQRDREIGRSASTRRRDDSQVWMKVDVLP